MIENLDLDILLVLYHTDNVTVEWLNKNIDEVFGYPEFIRFSWKNVENRINEKCKKIIC